MNTSFVSTLFAAHQATPPLPKREAVITFAEDILQLLFPHFNRQVYATEDEVKKQAYRLETDFRQMLMPVMPDNASIAESFFEQMPLIYELLMKDARAISSGDPAAKNTNEVILSYPGFYAIAIYRIAHALCKLSVPYVPRMLTEYAHRKTGIDIHPSARIGEYFCIDHGTGIVIGQTTRIGDYVKVYQGVTLGAVSVEKTLAGTKRHPTIEDHVVIYAGATILGGDVTVGAHSVIGGNVWLTESVRPYSKVYHKSQLKVSGQRSVEEYIEFYI